MPSMRALLAAFIAVAVSIASTPVHAQCERWIYGPEQRSFPRWGLNFPVYATLIWDADEAGPLLPEMYIGGSFTALDGEYAPLAHAARWNGARWVNLGAGLNQTVTSMALWDPDGPGPLKRQILAIGSFTAADGLPAARAARWDGAQWHALAGPAGLTGGTTSELCIFDPDGPGPLPEEPFAVVTITSGTPRTSSVARYDGSQWVNVGNFDNTVRSLSLWDADGSGPGQPVLLAGGFFSAVDSTTTGSLARWTGSGWAQFAGGVTSSIYAVGSWQAGPDASQLIISGNFTQVGGVSANYIASWDGAQWSPLGSGLGVDVGQQFPAVNDLASLDFDGAGPLAAELVAVGFFSKAGGQRALGVAAWNGAAWREIDTGLLRQGSPSTYYGPSCAVAWDPDGPGPGGDRLLVGGTFSSTGGFDGRPSMRSRYIALSDGQVWLPFASSFDDRVHAVKTFDPDGPGPEPGQLIMAGAFDRAGSGSDVFRSVVRWDGSQLSGMGGGLRETVTSLAPWASDLAGPYQLAAAGHSGLFSNWNGLLWATPTPHPWAAEIRAVTAWDPDGPGPAPGGVVAADATTIRFWNGTTWQALGAPFPFTFIDALASVDHDGPGPLPPTLYCAGTISAVNNIAAWDGAQWVSVAGGANNPVYALTSWDADGLGPAFPELVAAGQFSAIGGVTASRVARWNGAAWQPLGAGIPSGSVTSITPWDADGYGPIAPGLIVGGAFTVSGSQNIARWDGSAWVAMGAGLNGEPYDLTAFVTNEPEATPAELAVVGNFTTADGKMSFYWARWTQTGALWISHHPEPQSIDEGSDAVLTVTPASGYDFDGPLLYQWRRNGAPISDGPGGASPGGGEVAGAYGPALTIVAATGSDAGDYDCLISSGCGSVVSTPALLTVGSFPCPADFTGDDLVDFSDYLEFLNLYDALDPEADLTGDGLVDFADYLDFLNHYDAGC